MCHGHVDKKREWSREYQCIFAHSIWVCVVLQNFYFFSCIYILYGTDVKCISVASTVGSGGKFESCCNLYPYFTLLCIGGTEQQKSLGGKMMDFLWPATPAGEEGGGDITRALFVPF